MYSVYTLARVNKCITFLKSSFIPSRKEQICINLCDRPLNIIQYDRQNNNKGTYIMYIVLQFTLSRSV